jgi:uncharacterized protein (TIGR03083 family)
MVANPAPQPNEEEIVTEEIPQPALLPMAPADIRNAAAGELGRLTDLVNGLQPARWGERSAVREWSIGDVVTHLNLAFGLYRRLLGAVVSGSGAGTVWKALGRLGETVAPAASPALNALNRAIPKMLDRSLAPEVVKGQFVASSRALAQQLDAIGSNDYTRPVYYVGGPFPLSFFLAMVLNEMAIHGWDIQSRLQPDAHLSPEARAVLPWFYFSGTPFMLQPPKGTQGTVQVILEDPGAEMWWALGPKISQVAGRAPQADATIRGPSGIFSLVLAGRIAPADAFRTTSLTVEGNEALATALLGSWKIL